MLFCEAFTYANTFTNLIGGTSFINSWVFMTGNKIQLSSLCTWVGRVLYRDVWQFEAMAFTYIKLSSCQRQCYDLILMFCDNPNPGVCVLFTFSSQIYKMIRVGLYISCFQKRFCQNSDPFNISLIMQLYGACYMKPFEDCWMCYQGKKYNLQT